MTGKNQRRCSFTPKDKKSMARMDRLVASQIGGFGICGRPLCCATWLKNFNDISVSLREVRAQKVTLDPDLINGCCRHMKCCLSFELPNHLATQNPPISPTQDESEPHNETKDAES